MPIFMPEKCMRGYDDCKPLALIDSDSKETTYFCCGENNGARRQVEQDKYTLCFKNCDMDIEHDNDKRDLVHQMAVISQALAIIEEQDSEEYHGK
jgi:hypothetical protein